MASVIEREQAAAVRSRVTKARKVWRLHRKMCRICAQLSKDRSQYCDDGWAMRVELHHAKAANKDLRQPPLARQETLF